MRTLYMKLTGINHFLIWIGIMLGVAWWLFETTLHLYVFKIGGFLTELFPSDSMEIWMRSAVATLLIGYGFFAQFAFNRKKRADLEKGKLIGELQATITEIKTLRGLIPICARCKKIRDDEGFWQRFEKYIQDRSEAEFSHSICPDCAKELYPSVGE